LIELAKLENKKDGSEGAPIEGTQEEWNLASGEEHESCKAGGGGQKGKNSKKGSEKNDVELAGIREVLEK